MFLSETSNMVESDIKKTRQLYPIHTKCKVSFCFYLTDQFKQEYAISLRMFSEFVINGKFAQGQVH